MVSANDLPDVAELFDRITKLIPNAVPFDETIVRSVAVSYANEQDFLSGEGAASYGGRWNAPGLRAVYASLDISTAIHEAYQEFLSGGFPLSAIRPRVLAGARAKLGMVFDLTSPAFRRRLGFTLSDLLDEDWAGIQAGGDESWTQAIGRGCRAAGFEALLVPSARKRGGKNLVVFPDRLKFGSILTPLAAQELPPHPPLASS